MIKLENVIKNQLPWVKVTDLLPEEGARVLVHLFYYYKYDDREAETRSFIDILTYKNGTWTNDQNEVYLGQKVSKDDVEITHWLPLLKPKTNDEVEIEEADDVEKLMRVFSIENVERNIRTHNRGGIYITFNSGDNVKKNDLFEIKLYNKYYYFEAESIKVIGELLEVQAVETGYWADELSNLKQDIDLRDIIDIEVFPIKDEAKIKQIHEASCWC